MNAKGVSALSLSSIEREKQKVLNHQSAEFAILPRISELPHCSIRTSIPLLPLQTSRVIDWQCILLPSPLLLLCTAVSIRPNIIIIELHFVVATNHYLLRTGYSMSILHFFPLKSSGKT